MKVETFIVSFIGTASPVDIKRFASVTHENGGKWLVSKVNFIDDQVAALIKIQCPPDAVSSIRDVFSSQGSITTTFREGCESSNSHIDVHHLRIDATDRFGIVNEITHLLDNQRIRVVDMNCQRVFISEANGVNKSLFSANLSIKLPRNMSIRDIVSELESLSEDTRVIIEN